MKSKLSLKRFINNIPCVVSEIGGDSNECALCQSLLNFIVVNPTERIPLIEGATYIYTLFPFSNDFIAEFSLLSKLTGIQSIDDNLSSESLSFTTNFKTFKDSIMSFFLRPNGLPEPVVKNRVNRADEYGLQPFYDFIHGDPIKITDILNKKKGFQTDQEFIRLLAGVIDKDKR